ncbi:MAG: ribonuclease HII [Bacteroidetes bacterium]|nr:ribonuclease HII [Bacteroidota bacterium]
MKYICGIDEAGRGPLAGPVTASAVVLPDDFPVEILSDSKKMSSAKRALAEKTIKELALAWAVAWAAPATIDSVNIHNATLLTMKRAFEKLPIWIKDNCEVIVDGKFTPLIDAPTAAVIRGDSLIHEIMAASILAKTARDRWMEKISKIYPEWGFEKHKGYPTKEHRLKCQKFGLLPIHRKSFSKGGILTN